MSSGTHAANFVPITMPRPSSTAVKNAENSFDVPDTMLRVANSDTAMVMLKPGSRYNIELNMMPLVHTGVIEYAALVYYTVILIHIRIISMNIPRTKRSNDGAHKLQNSSEARELIAHKAQSTQYEWYNKCN